MKRLLFNFIFIFVLPFVLSNSLIAEVKYRGFQVGYIGLEESDVKSIAEEWNANVVRIQVGNNAEMDGTTGDDYVAMMDAQLAIVDEKLELFRKYGLKVVFALYSPPGGFSTREAPAHYAMFSQPELQDEFINMWVKVVQKYGSDSLIYAFDLLNEPAERTSLLCSTCDDWGKLSERLVAAIRVVNPTIPLMLKSAYGDPSRLVKLPIINDANVIYSYHAYPFNEYQHAGIGPISRSFPRPTAKRIDSKMNSVVGKFFRKVKKAVDDGEFPSYPPRMNVGEFAASACSDQDPAQFMKDLLVVLEGDSSSSVEVGSIRSLVAKVSKNNKTRAERRAAKKAKRQAKKEKAKEKRQARKEKAKEKRQAKKEKAKEKRQAKKEKAKEKRQAKKERAKKKRQTKKKKSANRSKRKASKRKERKRENRGNGNDTKKDKGNDSSDSIVHESWTHHAYGDAFVWDPRYVCNADGSFTKVEVDTDRGLVLKEFLARNN